MSNIQYIGARYVAKVYTNSSDNSSAEWEALHSYEPLTIVIYNNNSYISRKPVPKNIGTPDVNGEYWALTGYYNGQIATLQALIDQLQEYTIKNLLSYYKNDNNTDIDAMNDALAAVDKIIIDYNANLGNNTYTANNKKISSLAGVIVIVNDTTFNGSGNEFDLVCRFTGNIGINFVGNNNIIKGKYYKNTKIVATTTNYYNSSIHVTGDYNRCSVTTYNAWVGIIISGKYNVFDNCYVHDHYTGIIIAERSENISILNSVIKDIDVYQSSGADGILCQSYTHNIIVDNCFIDNVSEHCMYIQGSESIISNNVISNANADGIKLASYDEQGENYYNHNSKIIGNQSTNNGGADIRIQNVCVGTVIDNNTCGSLRIVNVLGQNYDPSKKLIISNNTIETALAGVFDEDVLISGNHIGRLEVTHQTASGVNCKILDNIIDGIATLNALDDSVFKGNTVQKVQAINGFWDIIDNDITGQDIDLDMYNVYKLNGNKIKFSDDKHIMCRYAMNRTFEIIGNFIDCNANTDTSKAPIDFPSASNFEGAIISNNVIEEIGVNVFLINVYSEHCVMQGNVGKCANSTMFRPAAAYATVDTNLRIIG